MSQSISDDKSSNASSNEKMNLLIDNVNKITNLHIPYVPVSQREARLLAKPWITKGILKSIRSRNAMYKKLCSVQFQDKELLSMYKKYRNKLSHLKELSKRNYYKKRFEIENKNMANTWKLINELTNKHITKETDKNIEQIETNGKKYKDPKLICEILNKHFVEIGENIAKVNNAQCSPTIFLNNKLINSMVLEDTTIDEIGTIIETLSINKATGHDGISTKVIKMLKSIISPFLCEIVNTSFKEGTFPNCLKIAKVIPCFKKGNKEDPNNYRPISVLTQFSKIFEKIIYVRYVNFFEKYNVISSNQYGFRKGFSTSLAVSDIYENLLYNLDEGYANCCIFIDFQKAFDTVNHQILIKKLEYYGVRGISLRLIQSYLSNRKQYVCMSKNIVSSLLNITCGVPTRFSARTFVVFSLY